MSMLSIEKVLLQINREKIDFLGGSVVKNLPASAEDAGGKDWIPESGRCPGGGHGNPFQYSFLENPLDREAWWATSPWGHEKADMTEATGHTCREIKYFKTNHKFYSIFFLFLD